MIASTGTPKSAPGPLAEGVAANRPITPSIRSDQDSASAFAQQLAAFLLRDHPQIDLVDPARPLAAVCESIGSRKSPGRT